MSLLKLKSSLGISLCLLLLIPIASIAQISIKPQTVEANLENNGTSEFLDGSSILKLADYFVWGGSVAKGKDGKYHMLFSLWESGNDTDVFSTSWVLESKIGYAVSDFPDRNFQFKGIILKGARYDGKPEAWDAQGVHNPHLKEFEGSYYLYYIGGRDPGERSAPDVDK